MRRVAERVDMTLAALQYHFPTRAELIFAMVGMHMDWYDRSLGDHLASLSQDPERLFLGAVDWFLADVLYAPSASFEIQFWAFAACDEQANILLDRFMIRYRNRLATLMRGVNPALGQKEALTRCAVISAMIDGTVMLVSPGRPSHPEFDKLHATARATAAFLAKAPVGALT